MGLSGLDSPIFFVYKIEKMVVFGFKNFEETELGLAILKNRYYNEIIILKKWNDIFYGGPKCLREKHLKS